MPVHREHPQPAPPAPPSRASPAALAAAVAGRAAAWAAVPDAEKLRVLRGVRTRLDGCVDEWAAACNASHRYAAAPHLHGCGYLVGPAILGVHLNALIHTYESLVATGAPPKGRERRVGKQTVVETYPVTTMDKLFYPGTIELWLRPGEGATQGACRRRDGLVAILGPGNFEAPTDILHAMFCESRVVVYSPHPNLAGSTAPFFARLLGELIDAGYLAVIDPVGDAGAMRERASQLIHAPEVRELVITGGCKTYDAIVWGGAPKGAGAKAFAKPVLAELGACSPYIIVPGKWTDAELDHHAGHLATSKLINSSAVCASPQVLIVEAGWAQRAAFLAKVEEKLRSAKAQGAFPPFYPGTQQRCDDIKAHHQGQATEFDLGPGNIKPVLIRLNEGEAGSYVCRNEAFAPVLAELPVTASGPADFLAKAQAVANSDRVFGSLSCSVIIPDRVAKELGAAHLDGWLQAQEWGTTALNDWAGMGAILGTGAWGAYPKHSPEDIQSGQGFQNNYMMYDHVEKAVVRAPFVAPGRGSGQPTLDDAAVARQMGRFATFPGVPRLLPLLAAAIGGRRGPAALRAAAVALLLLAAYRVLLRRR